MKKLFLAVLCFLTSVLCLSVSAQTWIIDGQHVQALEIHVSDPQALYTDGSREMTAPLAFSSSLTATSGMVRAVIPWDIGETEFFVIDEDTETLKLADTGNIGLKIGNMILMESAFEQTDEGTRIDFGEHMLYGGWQIDQVLPYDEAIISRGYADTRYLRADTPLTQPLTMAQSLTATNGALKIYSIDNEDHLSYFKTLEFQDGLQFCTEGAASLFFGSGTDGLLIGNSSLVQIAYGKRINFELGELGGNPGSKKWHVAEDPTEASGIVSKGYADGRYLQRTEGITTNRVIQAGDTLVISNGLIIAINP